MSKITEKDNWNADLYDNKHAFVSQFGEEIIQLLGPVRGEEILDLGCGTGDLTNKIHAAGANVIGVDKSGNMIEQAQQKHPAIQFQVEDATKLQYNHAFHAVFSNATLHWVRPPKVALSCIYHSLKKNGRLVAEFGGKGNVELITAEIKRQFKKLNISSDEERFSWYFPSIGEYTSLMEEVGFKVTFAHHFDRPTPLHGINGLSNWIEMFGKEMFKDIDEETKNRIITNAETNLKEKIFLENQWIADYKRIRVVGVKVGSDPKGV